MIGMDFNTLSVELKIAMQSCHSLSLANGKTVGNFVDVEMFKSTSSILDKTDISHIMPCLQGNNIKILKRFEFVHSNAYMSVVCQDLATRKVYVFLKGSSEKISYIAKCPSDFLAVAEKHSMNGCYVVAIAYKEIFGGFDNVMPREKIESDCQFLGMMLFRNELKEDSKAAV
jgi:magnesium-transporting ATPase (P-type)